MASSVVVLMVRAEGFVPVGGSAGMRSRIHGAA
jgi:hypothetical protein